MKETRVVTVLTMAVGIGLTTAVFSLIYAVLLGLYGVLSHAVAQRRRGPAQPAAASS